MSRYGRALERDLAREYPGCDLAAEWRGRRWRRLLNYIDGLPRSSAFVEAMADDEEYAALLLDQEDRDQEPRGPRLAEYTPEVERLDMIFDRLADIAGAVVAAGGVKPQKVKPAPRPVTALDRLRHRRSKAHHFDLVARVLPQAPSE